MEASIDLTAVADQLTDCKPGDEYTVTFVVDEKTDAGLTGTASEIEHIGGEDYEDEEEAPRAVAVKKRGGVPKAILMISK